MTDKRRSAAGGMSYRRLCPYIRYYLREAHDLLLRLQKGLPQPRCLRAQIPPAAARPAAIVSCSELALEETVKINVVFELPASESCRILVSLLSR